MSYKNTYIYNKGTYFHVKSHSVNYIGGGEDDMKLIDDMAKSAIEQTKSIKLSDLKGLNMRVYERDNKNIKEILFTPLSILEYLNNHTDYIDYYEKTYGNILKNELSDVILDFDTKIKEIDVAFYDNYINGKKSTFKINLPIKLVDFIYQLFNHFDQVGLEGYPDNGGIDHIIFDDKTDVYLVKTWS
jgi:hypothetical protein